MYYRKNYNYISRTSNHLIECIQVWILPGYPINTGNYTSKRKLGRFPTSPRLPPVGNFFNIHLNKNIIEQKNLEFYFRIGYILVVFPFL